MKKIIYSVLFILLLIPLYVCAQVIPDKIYACSIERIDTSAIKAGQILDFHSIGTYEFSEDKYIEEKSIITIMIEKYIEPKRGKRDGYAKIKLIKYTIPSKDNEIVCTKNDNITGTLKLSNPIDKKDIFKSAGVSAAGHFLKIPGFSQAFAVSKGLIKPNPEQNRLQSAGTNLYESTPLTYAEKGIDLEIEEDAIVVIKLRDEDN